ncbi:hypothetical protein BBJ29_005608 [Phytophthora kernoviae]|uniref:PAS domain-containing protein n=1 Tax=Phytophthora kernoviae TaxID=325452 RepID=A0A3F2RI15_9STRA|nr:hypothetical protein BBP00_00007554 [Phytophthora kernoviae]RLN71798.1 hypothetical protein BBJ29_005608 [Phytophthora kernoviae]
MDFSAPNESDVDMAMHDDPMLNANLAAQYGHPQQQSQSRPLPPHPGLPSSMGGADPQAVFPGLYVPGLNPMDQPQQGDAMEEYARLMGIKVENDDPNVNGNAFGNDIAKIQANAAYFENLINRDRNDAMEDGNNVTSMTLPAGLGSGMNGVSQFMGPMAPAPPMYNPTTELAFQDGGGRLYDPSSGFPGQNPPMPFHKGPPVRPGIMAPDMVGSQTLPPEYISAMIKNNPAHNFENLSEDEKQALIKEEKSRERNRDHSRKSRLRKKEFVESLKHEVGQLQVYQQICEQCMDCIALVAAEASAVFLYSSAAYTRVLGYQNHQIVPGQTSFLDMVHPDNVQDVRSVFTKLTTLGETYRFKFRIKSMDGEFFNAETTARLAEKGVVCSTRVDRNI